MLYALFLLVDIAAAAGLLILAARYAAAARRGTLFTIPIISPISDRWKAADRDDEERTRTR